MAQNDQKLDVIDLPDLFPLARIFLRCCYFFTGGEINQLKQLKPIHTEQ